MSLIPGFDYDLFISYSHVDNQSLTEGQKGWIDAFHQALERRLAQWLESDPEVFRDPKLAGNDYFEDVLPARLRKTAILISIVSPRYAKSPWCQKELQVFCDVAEDTGGIRVGDKARIFKVIKMPVELEHHPPQLQGLLGYDFYMRDDKGVALELSPDLGDEARLRFIQRVNDLAHQIRQLIHELLESSAPAGDTIVRRAVPRPGSTVYLAHTTYDLQDARDGIRRELEQRGHTVLPDRELPPGPQFRDAVREQLARASLSIHPVGANYGMVPETEEESIVAIQHELGAEWAAASGSIQLVWAPRDLVPADERQRAFVERLEAETGSFDFLRTSLEELKTTVHDMLDHPQAVKDESGPEDGPPSVYLVCDRADFESVRPLEDHLFETGYEVLLPAREGDEAEVREDHRQNLLTSDAVLVYWGRAGEAWLRAQLRELQKAPGYGRTNPLRASAVYVAPPGSAAKDRFRSHQFTVVRGAEAFQPVALESFVRRLDESKMAG
ncbi:MAG: TIR domain-containing protein [Gemmatimonadetes bacterium]|nr:TIR domain-containing protein [Gemmatimonadota bacterium]